MVHISALGSKGHTCFLGDVSGLKQPSQAKLPQRRQMKAVRSVAEAEKIQAEAPISVSPYRYSWDTHACLKNCCHAKPNLAHSCILHCIQSLQYCTQKLVDVFCSIFVHHCSKRQEFLREHQLHTW
jgi:hypothetical protein